MYALMLKGSLDRIAPNADKFMAAFYHRLFTRHPEIKARHFAGVDMEHQQRQMFKGLTLIITNIDHVPGLVAPLSRLGIQHERMPCPPTMHHYYVMWEALVDTVCEFEGPHWTDELHRAWYTAYFLAAGFMVEEGARWRLVARNP